MQTNYAEKRPRLYKIHILRTLPIVLSTGSKIASLRSSSGERSFSQSDIGTIPSDFVWTSTCGV